MPRERISIAMATYNGASFLKEQLESFARQTRLPDELVVTDDSSTDGSLELLQGFARAAPFPVRVHRNPENLGFTRNFEMALSLCTGDIIFLSDQDDVWLPEKIATVAGYFERDPSAQVIVNDALLVDASLHGSGHTQRQNIVRAGQSLKSFFTGCCSAHRRSWHELALPIPPEIPAHDFWINCLAIELGCARQITEVLQLFRRHEGNSSAWALSDPGGVGFFSLLRMSGLRDARPRWRLRADLLRAFLERTDERSALTAANGWNGCIPSIGRELANLEERIRLCSMARPRRALGVVDLWLRDGYRDAAGWKSAAKDLIRP